MDSLLLALISLIVGALVTVVAFVLLRGRLFRPVEHTLTHTITERVRSVGKLVGLEVMSKEIVTQTKGLPWLPPLLLSQARLAMIFCFNKQYFVNLTRLRESDVRQVGPNRYEVVLPKIEGDLSLLEVTPYDIQSGKFIGLLDVFRMDAETQKTLMMRAQEEAEKLYEKHADRYAAEARRVIVRQLKSLLELFDVEAEIRFRDDGAIAKHPPTPATDRVPTPASA
ncbi:MAG: DUF4230 domain-containing protein [Phycisphaerales bacterium]